MIKITILITMLLFSGCELSSDYKYTVTQDDIQFYTNTITKLDNNCMALDKDVTVCGTYAIRNNPTYKGR